MEDRTPTGNPDSLKRARNERAPAESRNLRETGRHVPKHFDDTERKPELEPPVELPPKKPFGLSRKRAEPDKPGGNRN
ncbi:MAG: hypothetical protein BGN87_19470 [Rhizobiales bacterium 65-79]|jgi:hypothetical protein|nr:hypothetical protein [Hyphomicrobiales bacterium]OJU02005.1 MAG: hypothetical protein BGN87_19470 [Rhizobiales bacterium 65-79]